MLTRDGDEYFVNEERVAKSGIFAPGPFRIQSARLVASKSHRFKTHFDSKCREQVFDVALVDVETMVKPDCGLNDRGRKLVSFEEVGWGFIWEWSRHPT